MSNWLLQKLETDYGFNLESLGPKAVEQAVAARVKACGAEPSHYLQSLEDSPQEMEALLEELVVPESWFFRERVAIDRLVELAAARLATGQGVTMRILSVPCAAGEEPFSVVMAVHDASLHDKAFEVHGVDISAKALERARAGFFRSASFRGGDLQFRERYFRPSAEGWQLQDEVHRRVRLHRASVVGKDSMPFPPRHFDAILCRNLLIYLNDAARQKVFSELHRLLHDDGLLFLSACEASLYPESLFAMDGKAKELAFRKASAAPPNKLEGGTGKSAATATAGVGVYSTKAGTASKAGTGEGARPTRTVVGGADRPTVRLSAVSAASSPTGDLTAAQELADQGRFAEAAAICEAHLQKHGPSAQSYYLLGLVHSAAGRVADAEKQLQRAMYLDPQHEEALLLLTLLKEQQGQTANSAILRRRLGRIAKGK